MKLYYASVMAALCLAVASCCQESPYGATPSGAQLRWQQMETNMFVHFGPNTFSGQEWGSGAEAEDLFNPSDLDCRQWARTALAAGFKGIIITAKHHDGFCLWPNPGSSHTVRESSWREGRGDVLRELSDACREYGLGFGVYISPWDRHDPAYGTPEYNNVYVRTLQSVLGGAYGTVFEQWFDGACGEGPGGKKQVYDWPLFNSTVASLQNEAVIFSDVGPGCRWVGNEDGYAGRTSWSTLNTEGFEPGKGSPDRDTLNQGNVGGTHWVPSETDVSIRPGWFWRESENASVKDLQALLKIYYESVGRNSLLLLNVPPDTRGRICKVDSLRLMEWREALDSIFSDDLAKNAKLSSSSSVRGHRASALTNEDYHAFWLPRKGDSSPAVTLSFPEQVCFNRVLLQEYIPMGQRIAAFTIEAMDADGSWRTIARETTVGYKRIVLTPPTRTTAVRITVKDALKRPALCKAGLYLDTVYEQPVI